MPCVYFSFVRRRFCATRYALKAASTYHGLLKGSTMAPKATRRGLDVEVEAPPKRTIGPEKKSIQQSGTKFDARLQVQMLG